MSTQTLGHLTKYSYSDYDISATCVSDDVEFVSIITHLPERFNEYRIRIYNKILQKETNIIYYLPANNGQCVNIELNAYDIMIAIETLLIEANTGALDFESFVKQIGYTHAEYEKAKLDYKRAKSAYNRLHGIFGCLDFEIQLVQSLIPGIEDIRIGDTVMFSGERGTAAYFQKDQIIVYTDNGETIKVPYSEVTKIN